MDCVADEVREYYDGDPAAEWQRLEKHPFEFEVTTRLLSRYIKPGDRVLDIGGGPGRYSLWAAARGCYVTLCDLSGECVRFAQEKAREQELSILAVQGDAREVSQLVSGRFDHVLLMGPLYHILEEEGRRQAVTEALSLLVPGGQLYASFILLFSGLIYAMKYQPEQLCDEREQRYVDCVLEGSAYSGDAFTKTFFIPQGEVLPFMDGFGLEKQTLFGQESILSPCEETLLAAPPDVREAWIDAAVDVCERPEFLAYSEHAMYVGKKPAK